MSDNEKNIELEIRAEISKEEFQSLFNQLKRKYRLVEEKDRMSVMFFGSMNEDRMDVRVRITNGKAEVVAKKGDFHEHNRIEVAQDITPDQFIGLVKLVSLFNFEVNVKVGPRKSVDFNLGDGIIFSLADAGGKYFYIEIEKMTNREEEENDRNELDKIAKDLGLKIIGKEEFHDLCKRLDVEVDWEFLGKEEDYERLKKELNEHLGKHVRK